MKMDILAILMVAFCLFAIAMFILFYVYAKKYRNEKNISEDYKEFDDEEEGSSKEKIELIDIMINGKDYVFEANGYRLYSGEEVNVLINDNIFTGTVTKSNYKDDADNYTQVPTKLILEGKKEISEDDIEINNYDNVQESYEKTVDNHNKNINRDEIFVPNISDESVINEDTQISQDDNVNSVDEDFVPISSDESIVNEDTRNNYDDFNSGDDEFIPIKKND